MGLFDTSIQRLNLEAPEQRGNALENPATSLSAPASWLFDWATDGGPSLSGISVSEQSALNFTTVFACIRILSESVSSLPIYVYERVNNGRKPTTSHPIYNLLAVSPNQAMTPISWVEAMMMSVVTNGNGYSEIVRNGAGQPVEVWPLDPLKTKPRWVPKNRLVYDTTDTVDGTIRTIDASDMLHVPALAKNGIVGISPIAHSRQAIGLALAAERSGATLFGNSTMISGMVNVAHKMDDKGRETFRRQWEQMYSGNNSHRVAVLDGGDVKFTPLTMNAQDAQYLQVRQFQRAEILQIYRILPHQLGIETRAMGKGAVESLTQDFITNTLRPYLIRFEQEFQRKLFPSVGRSANKFFAEFHLDSILRADFLTRQQGHALARQWGWECVDEIRAQEGLNPLPGDIGQQYLVPMNMVQADNTVTAKVDSSATDNADESEDEAT
ncbi:MAG TPA: phage portal protein [Acidobacteriaceae bacterium]|nr:phage portal protein [Acidobacteriaceae bacterium]